MTSISRALNTPTPQSEPLDERQVPNSAGGYAYEADKWERLNRFLILGTDGGTFYIGERDLTLEGLAVVDACLAEDGKRAIERAGAASAQGRARRNGPAALVLAAALAHEDVEVRRSAAGYVPVVCRTGTHLFEFLSYFQALGRRGWGVIPRRAVARWYVGRPPLDLALQGVKYRNRYGWTHRDALRVSHPVPSTPAERFLFGHLAGNATLHEDLPPELSPAGWAALLRTCDRLRSTETPADTAKEIEHYRAPVPWEAVQSDHLNDPAVLRALLPPMPYIATLRNLARFTRAGVLDPLGPEARLVADRLRDPDRLRRSRVHPLQLLDAFVTYESGGRAGRSRGDTYEPNQTVLAALDEAFLASFGNVEPTGKNRYVALDVSPSMGAPISGSAVLSCSQASAALALTTVKTEPNTYVAAFASDGDHWTRRRSHQSMKPVNLTRSSGVGHAIQSMPANWGGTDCALPMLDAKSRGLDVDVFEIYTDSETWYGDIHPMDALRSYRRAMGKPEARLVVVAMAGNRFSIADPADPLTLDVVGFDPAAPNAISAFIRGEV